MTPSPDTEELDEILMEQEPEYVEIIKQRLELNKEATR